MLPYQEEPIQDYEEDATTWIALSDLMTGLMAIFLALSIAILTMYKSDQIVIIKSVKDVMEKNNIETKYNEETGEIILSESIAFKVGDDQLTEQGKLFLNQFIPIYAKAIFGELTTAQQNKISRLIVEGHSDKQGGELYNMNLSSRRAYAIIAYIHTMEFQYKQQLLHKMTVVGRGANDATDYNNPADRKVIFRFDFKPFDEKKGGEHAKQSNQEMNNIPKQVQKEMNQNHKEYL